MIEHRAQPRSSRFAAACAVFAFAASCGGGDAEPAIDTGALTHPGANVVLLIVDTLRADILTPYGGPEELSSNLSRMADEGVLFENCRASSPWTLPSMGSIFTGLYPRAHGAGLVGIDRCVNRKPEGKYGTAAPIPREGKRANRLASDVATIATTFARAGYATYLRSTNPYYSYGLNEGFENQKKGSGKAAKVVDWGLSELRARDPSKPFFLTLHFIDVHTNKMNVNDMAQDLVLFEKAGRPALNSELRGWELYDDDPANFVPMLDDRFRMYKACMRYVDRQVGRLLSALEKMNVGPTYVVFTSDHGEDFRDHWDVDIESGHFDPRRQFEKVLGIGHGHSLHQSLTHVPLIVSGPGLPAGLRVPETVSLVDIMPTLCELTGVDALGATDGRSLVARMAGVETEALPYISESIAYGREKTAFFSPDGYLLIQPRSELERPQLFDLASDPTERRNLYDEERPRAKALLRELKRWEKNLASRQGESQIDDAESLQRLQDLGYAGDE